MKNKKYDIVIEILISIGIMLLATCMGVVFREIRIAEANIIMLYILGVVIAARYAVTQWGGTLASVLGVVMFNYFFTEPYYSLTARGKEYPVTFLIMFAVALITSTLTQKIKKEAAASKERGAYTQSLYDINKKLLMIKNLDEAKTISAINIAHFLGKSVILFPVNEKNEIEEPISYNQDENMTDTKQNLRDSIVIKNILVEQEKYYSQSNHTSYIPIKGQERMLSIIGIRNFDFNTLSIENSTLLEAVIAQVALAFEREYIAIKQQHLKLTIQSEKLKNNMLQSISHDLRTPLTGIVGATSTLLEQHQALDEKVKIQLLTSVYEDAIWLNHSVENILNITRIDDGRLAIVKHIEVAEEVAESVLARINKNLRGHQIEVSLDKEFILVPMDASLIVQVLYNLIDNAIKYTPEGTMITLKVYKEENKAVFEVEDNGMGIPEKYIGSIFKRFYRISSEEANYKETNEASRMGMGLGLSICKAVVEAHDGKISMFNNVLGGASFKIELPMEGDENSGE